MTISQEPQQQMDLPQPNLPLLRKVLDHIDAHPDQWNQSYFTFPDEASSCGTVHCVAGWAAVLTAEVDHERELVTSTGQSIEEYARSELGLNDNEASELFWQTLYYQDDARRGEVADKATQRRNVELAARRIAARAGEVL